MKFDRVMDIHTKEDLADLLGSLEKGWCLIPMTGQILAWRVF